MKHRYAGYQEKPRYVETLDTYRSFEEAFDAYYEHIREIAFKDRKVSMNLFPLARLTLSLEKSINRKVDIDELECIFDRWYEVISEWSSDFDESDLFEEFTGVYLSTKVALDEGLMEAAFRRAEQDQSPPGIHLLKKQNKDTILLVSLCYQLHLHHDGAFYLSVRTAQRLLPKFSVQTINNKMRYLTLCGVIREVEKGTL